MNLLVNVGVIIIISLVDGKIYDEIWGKIEKKYNEFVGCDLKVLDDVY